MTKRTYSSDVEQFSAWNQQLRSLLREGDEKQDVDHDKTNNDLEDSDDTETKDTDLEKYSSKFKSTGNHLGNGIYTMSIYNHIDSVWAGTASDSPNGNLVKIVNDLAENLKMDWETNSFGGWLTSGAIYNRDEIYNDRILILAVYDDKNKELHRYKAVGKTGSIDYTGSQGLDTTPGLKKLQKLTEKWIQSIPEDVPNSEVSTPDESDDKNWEKAENALIGYISNAEVVSSSHKPDWMNNVGSVGPMKPEPSLEQGRLLDLIINGVKDPEIIRRYLELKKQYEQETQHLEIEKRKKR